MGQLKRVTFRLGTLAVIAAVAWISVSGCQSDAKQQTSIQADSTDLGEAKKAGTAKDSVTIEMVAIDSTTAFEILRREHYVAYKSSAMGVFVTAIDSIVSTSDRFWLCSVNDSMLQVASDRRAVHPGDTVRWHLR